MKNQSANKKITNYTKKIVLIGLLTATLTGGKFALMVLPNVEIVTLFLMLYSYVFGLWIGFLTSIAFVTIEVFIFGFNSWVVSYYIYWPLLVLVTWLLKGLIAKNEIIIPTLIAIVMTTFFGVLTSFVDTLFLTTKDLYLKVFVGMYIRGVSFFVVHIVFNALFVGISFKTLAALLKKLKQKFFVETPNIHDG